MKKPYVLDNNFQQFKRDIKYANAITSTQTELFGDSLTEDKYYEGYLQFMDLVQGRRQKEKSPYIIFDLEDCNGVPCPICNQNIVGLDSLLDECEDKEMKQAILRDYRTKGILPVQCPKGHTLTYDSKKIVLIPRQKSEIDYVFEIAKRKGFLTAIFSK